MIYATRIPSKSRKIDRDRFQAKKWQNKMRKSGQKNVAKNVWKSWKCGVFNVKIKLKYVSKVFFFFKDNDHEHKRRPLVRLQLIVKFLYAMRELLNRFPVSQVFRFFQGMAVRTRFMFSEHCWPATPVAQNTQMWPRYEHDHMSGNQYPPQKNKWLPQIMQFTIPRWAIFACL